MTESTHPIEFPTDFSGRVRLFPLPSLVLFPHAVQPLRIFEPRFREMLVDALGDDKLIAMAVLSPGWEKDYEGRPPIEPIVCVGKVISHAENSDGTYNILLAGMRRARIIQELPPMRSFRQANVKLIADVYPAGSTQGRAVLRKRMIALYSEWMPEFMHGSDEFAPFLSSDTPLGVLTDLMAFVNKWELSLKVRLLAEPNVDERARMICAQLEEMLKSEQSQAPDDPPFPPRFSDN